MTYRYVAYSVLETLKQQRDDSRLSLSQVVFFIQLVANRLRYQHLLKSKTGSYLTIFNNVSITPVSGYSYLTLPSDVIDLPSDGGIAFISYPYKNKGEWLCLNFQITDAAKIMSIKWDAYEKPSSSNPYAYRVGDKVHLLGCDGLNIKNVVVGLYTALDSGTTCDLDSDVPINEEHIESLLYNVLNLARFGMVVTPDMVNDGSDDAEKINAVQKIMGFPLQSVEEQQQQQQQQ